MAITSALQVQITTSIVLQPPSDRLTHSQRIQILIDHHEVRAKRKRRPPFEQEQAGADRWGEQATNHIYHRLEDHKAHLDEWAHIREGFKRQKGPAA